MPKLRSSILTLLILIQFQVVGQELANVSIDDTFLISLPSKADLQETSDRIKLLSEDAVSQIAIERKYLGHSISDSMTVYAYSDGNIAGMRINEARTIEKDTFQVINNISMRILDIRSASGSIFTNVYFTNSSYIYIIRFQFKSDSFNYEYIDKVLYSIKKK